MITLGPQAQAQLKNGDYLAASCLSVQFGAVWKLTNSGRQILDYLANGLLNEIEPGVLDGSPSGETKTIEINDPDGVIYADALANNHRGKSVTVSTAIIHTESYQVLDDTLYEEFSGFIDSMNYSNNVLTITARDQYSMEYQGGRRSNDASIKSHFPNDTSHEHLPNLPTEIKWGSITL